MKHITNTKRGFTILFAVLVASVILAVVVSVMNIALKQLQFSGIGRESQFAYYAADTGVECALFWDFRSQDILGYPLFATSSESGIIQDGVDTVALGNEVTCGRTQIYNDGSFMADGQSSTKAVTDFMFEIESNISGTPRTFCSKVTVVKEYSNARQRILTTISSRGYNDGCAPSNRTRYERGLEIKY